MENNDLLEVGLTLCFRSMAATFVVCACAIDMSRPQYTPASTAIILTIAFATYYLGFREGKVPTRE